MLQCSNTDIMEAHCRTCNGSPKADPWKRRRLALFPICMRPVRYLLSPGQYHMMFDSCKYVNIAPAGRLENFKRQSPWHASLTRRKTLGATAQLIQARQMDADFLILIRGCVYKDNTRNALPSAHGLPSAVSLVQPILIWPGGHRWPQRYDVTTRSRLTRA